MKVLKEVMLLRAPLWITLVILVGCIIMAISDGMILRRCLGG